MKVDNRPYFLSDIQRDIRALPSSLRCPVKLLLIVDNEDRYRTLEFEMPAEEILAKQFDLYQRYFLAMLNNMVVSFGGKELCIYMESGKPLLSEIADYAISCFQADRPTNDRIGYGVYLNYINRMNRFLGLPAFKIRIYDLIEWTEPDPNRIYHIYEPEDEGCMERLRRSATELLGKSFCSLDVGGNSIKCAVIQDGEVLLLKEYRWYPTGCRTPEEINTPPVELVRWLALSTVALSINLNPDKGLLGDPDCSIKALMLESERLEKLGLSGKGVFDAIIIGYPDIVVNNKIAGGESLKHHGLKSNPELDYEEAFFLTSDLDDMVRPYVREGYPVIVLNDGNAAAYITSVEMAFSGKNVIGPYGMFANTIGTEMGTGFISVGGTIQTIPLEGFQHVIDLGSRQDACYEPFDLRSGNSTNTGISGVVQKFVSQLGLFRFCINAMLKSGDPILDELIREGSILVEEDGSMKACLSPHDRRDAITRRLIGSLSKGNESVAQAFRMMGKALGVLIDQDLLIFPEIEAVRLLSGGIIANDEAYKLLEEGLYAHDPKMRIIRLDEKTMYSPLLKSMKESERRYNVAIGSVYIGNRFLTNES